MSIGHRPRGFDPGAANDPVDLVLSMLPDAKPSGKGWVARCPAHRDRKPSLSIGRGDDGRALVYCHSGCTEDEVCAALGITVADLYAARDDAGSARRRNAKPQPKSKRHYPTAAAAIESLLNRPELNGAKVTQHIYNEAFIVLRFDFADDRTKTFRPIHRTGDGWATGKPPGKLPLYGIAEMPSSGTIYVVEGEKACDAARSIGLYAVTSAHGSKSADKTDWLPLAGRDIVVLPDNNLAGLGYATKVARILHAFDCSVRIVEMPNLPDGGDIADLVAACSENQDASDIARDVESLAERAPAWRPAEVADDDPVERLAPVMPFDPAWLPESLRDWVIDIVERSQVPPDFPAIGAMVALASIVGRKVGIRPKRRDDWLVVPNLWGAAVGRPGVMKTPALREVLQPLTRLEIRSQKTFKSDRKAHEAAAFVARIRRKEAERAIKETIGQKRDALSIARHAIEQEPAPLIRRRYLANDATVEKLGELLNENPNGILVFRDELVGLLRSLDKQGQECARAFYLEAWDGAGRFTYDRIGRGTIDIESVTVSILGGVPPGPLRNYLVSASEGGRLDDGLMQRFQLLVWPDVSPEWKNVDRWPDTVAKKLAFDTFTRLDGLQGAAIGAEQEGDDGIPFLRFSEDAQNVFDGWRERLEHRVRSGDEQPAIEAHLAKFRSLVPSLALLIHLAAGHVGPVGVDPLEKALRWAEYLESHARRVYGSVSPRGAGRDRAELDEFIRARGGTITVRELQRERPREFRASAENARRALDSLVADGRGIWEYPRPGEAGGRPSPVFHLNDFGGDNDKTAG